MERIHLVNKAIYVGISICVAKISGYTGSVQFNLGGIYTSAWIKSLVPYLRTKHSINWPQLDSNQHSILLAIAFVLHLSDEYEKN